VRPAPISRHFAYGEYIALQIQGPAIDGIGSTALESEVELGLPIATQTLTPDLNFGLNIRIQIPPRPNGNAQRHPLTRIRITCCGARFRLKPGHTRQAAPPIILARH
jgi:hypothetical protein